MLTEYQSDQTLHNAISLPEARNVWLANDQQLSFPGDMSPRAEQIQQAISISNRFVVHFDASTVQINLLRIQEVTACGGIDNAQNGVEFNSVYRFRKDVDVMNHIKFIYLVINKVDT